MFNCDTYDDFLALLGSGLITAHQLTQKLAGEAEPPPFIAKVLPAERPDILGIQVLGVGDLLTRLAACCNPLPGDDIIGFITRSQGITVHRKDCSNIINLKERERLIGVKWGRVHEVYPVNVEIEAWNRVGVLRDIAAVIAYNLARSHYRVSTATSGAEALNAAVREKPDLIVLDVMLPEMSGYEILEKLRARSDTRDTGVILLTARTEENDRLKGLSLGADDYLSKPFSPKELVLRVEAVLRRLNATPVSAGSVLAAGPIELDQGAHTASLDGSELDLTATEYKLLAVLLERRGRVQSRERLLQDVWDASPEIKTRTVDMHVQRLRTKLGPAAEVIETVRGVGYRFKKDDAN